MNYQPQSYGQVGQPINQIPQQNFGVNQVANQFPLGGIGNNFHMGISETVDDPFSGMTGFSDPMGFGGFQQIQNQINSHIQNALASVNQMGVGSDQMMMGMQAGNNQGITEMTMIGAMPGKGTMFTKQMCTKVNYVNGKPLEEKYQAQSISQTGPDGHHISEKQEAYKNAMTGIQQAANQRILDERGIKEIRKQDLNAGTNEAHNVLRGMQENEIPTFNQQYSDYRNKIHFQDNYQYLNQLTPDKFLPKAQAELRNILPQGYNQNFNALPQGYPQQQGTLQSLNNIPQGIPQQQIPYQGIHSQALPQNPNIQGF